MRVNQLATKKNLRLAWRRITTGGNYQYKHLCRPIYYAYEVALDANLADLRQRLLVELSNRSIRRASTFLRPRAFIVQP